ncbi:hypothetical protein [Fibrivirga algicola]|uniref:YtxH domain-containing protein n=1 Tax=Fibrivirga algicola TaxID=2950420 RepID=A0ABX0QHK3_9BACT|nr:hypothetical protein [Fibrivirga algicola]ARK10392.1 hypothetical protein A6C57_08650 [Fibrella sp. ES10-3-2-2]NID11885.1 hypothetical protein [Fibrivirga algicola]
MEDPKVPFADTTARRAQLMEATERFKSSIQDSVDSLKTDASEVGKTTALVAGVAFGVFLLASLILPKSDEYRYAEKYGEPDDRDYTDHEEEDDEDDTYVPRQQHKAIRREAKETQKSAAATGLIGGLLTSVLTNIAREQISGLLTRIRTNNAINPTAQTAATQYHETVPNQPVSYTDQL